MNGIVLEVLFAVFLALAFVSALLDGPTYQRAALVFLAIAVAIVGFATHLI